MNIYQLVNQHGLNFPDKVACIYNEQLMSYSNLLSQVDSFAQGLLNIGITSHSRIALLCPNNMQFVVSLLAAAKLGCAIVPLPLTLKGKALKLAITGAECDFAIAWPTVVKLLVKNNILELHQVVSLADVDFGTTSLMNVHYYFDLITTKTIENIEPANCLSDFILTMTSGSTGSPKPIIFTQKTKIDRAFQATIDHYQLTSNDTVLVATPLYHSLAQRSLLMPLMLGATVVILPKFSLQAWLNAISKHRVSFLFAVSNQLVALLAKFNHSSITDDDDYVNEYDFSSLRCLVSSSATLKEADKKLLLSHLNCHFHECYGASEVGVVTDFDITEKGVPLASVGRALSDIKLKICDKNRSALMCGEIGEIACLTSTRFKGYFNLPEQTRASFDDEGYFYTGDLGYLDQQGYLYFVGRTKEVIKSGGINVYPKDIESVLIELPEIKECAALGIVDEKFGEVIWVAYVLEDEKPFDEKKLMLQAMQQLTDYQQPRFYQRFTQFPKSALGKILKQEIKAELMAIKLL
jgi:long-chain acyl-CoA synthetase